MLWRGTVVLLIMLFQAWRGPQRGLERRDCLTLGVFGMVFGLLGMLLPALLPPGGREVLLAQAPLSVSLAGGAAGVAAGVLLFRILFGRHGAEYGALFLPLLPLLRWWAGAAGWRICAAQVLVLLFCVRRGIGLSRLVLLLVILECAALLVLECSL